MTIEEIRSKIMPLLIEYEVSKASVFGSTARGDMTEDSDIDLLVEFKGERSLLDLAGLKLDLEEILHRKVDVLTYDSLHHLLREGILNEQKVLL